MGISINKPCSEDWSKMTPTEKGAFCKKCTLEVHDFSGKSPVEIKHILVSHPSGSLCGRISPTTLAELNVDFQAWERNNKRSFQSVLVFSLIVAFGLALFSCTEEEKRTFGEIQTVGQSFIQQKNDDSPSIKDSTVANFQVEQPNVQKAIIPEIKEDQIAPDYPREYIKGKMIYEPEPEEVEVEPIEMMLGGMAFSPAFTEYVQEEVQNSQTEIEVAFYSKIFPNPAKENAQLEIETPHDIDAQVKLFNLAGEQIKDVYSGIIEKGTQRIPLNLDGLKEGIYLVTIHSKDYSTSIKLRKS